MSQILKMGSVPLHHEPRCLPGTFLSRRGHRPPHSHALGSMGASAAHALLPFSRHLISPMLASRRAAIATNSTPVPLSLAALTAGTGPSV